MLNQESKFKYYPDIIFSNSSVDIKNESASIFIRESNIKIMKSYWPLSPLNINLKAPVMKVNGLEINNIFIKAKYNNNILNITEFKGNIAEGNFQISGNTQLSELIPFALNGKFNNISLNTFLQQSEIAVWDRLTVKLSSDNFKINGYASNKKNLLKSIEGEINLSGSAYLTTTDEERFGAALLSLLVEKIPSISSLSKSLNFIISKYGNIPTKIKGGVNINNGKIFSDNIQIYNNLGQSKMIASIDILANEIDGKIFLYENNEVFIETSLEGSIDNPKIIIDGKIFGNEKQEGQDLKKIFQQGINSVFDSLLQIE